MIVVAQELAPGVFTALFAKYQAKSRATGVAALTAIALAVEREAKRDLGRSSHRYGTKTPASPGGPPALISGTLRRSVTHTPPVSGGGGVEMRVGPAAGFYPPRYSKGKRRRGKAGGSATASSKYGLYLETGLRNGATYPWLQPAFERAASLAEVTAIFTETWRRV